MFTAYETNNINEDTGLPEAAGRVYALANPAWPGLIKIGSSTDIGLRLRSYQTGSPHRDYKVIAWSSVFAAVRRVEFALHRSLALYKVEGSREWFRISSTQAIAALRGAASLSDTRSSGVEDAFAAYGEHARRQAPLEPVPADDPFDDLDVCDE